MKQLVAIERFCLTGHILSLIFGLAGLLLVLPNPGFIAALPTAGQALFGWSMAGGGVVYILLGAVTMALYAYRRLGWRNWLLFMLPAVGVSLSSELLGTSTGFPFGHYTYLNGLGYKIAGLVPFTIPLSWFYIGLSTYLLAWAGLEARGIKGWIKQVGTIALGALLLTAWDFVLDPAMSQTAYPFWEFHDPGQFFGMPYRNLTGWLGTGVLFMSVATFFWRKTTIVLTRSQLTVPLVIYLVNFTFGAVITLDQLEVRFWIPTAIGVVLGVIPAVALWWFAKPRTVPRTARESVSTELAVAAEREFSSYLIKEASMADIVSKKKDLVKNTQKKSKQRSSFTETSLQHQTVAAPTAMRLSVPDQGDRGRVIIFIDGSNLFYAASSLKIEIDYVKLLRYLMAEDCLVHVLFYTGYDPTNEKQRGFLYWMGRNGFRVITKAVTQDLDGFKNANLDVEIAVDMMRLAQHCDTAVLVSGDGDFVYVVNMIASQGVRVEVVGLRSMTSSFLIDVADCYTDLAAIQNTVKSSSALS